MKDFEKKIVELEGDLRRFAGSLTGDPTRAEDLLQDTYMKALKGRSKFKEGTYLKAWMFTIMRNHWYNEWKRLGRTGSIFQSSEGGWEWELPVSAGDGAQPDHQLGEAWISSKIDALRPKLRDPFKAFLEGWSYEEIGDRFDLKMGTVKSRIHFAREELKLALRSGGYREGERS